jgi:phosphoglycerate dehydrogenase-like enzyme
MEQKIHLLVNLPPTFFSHRQLAPYWERAARIADIRQRSWNTMEEMAPELPWCEAILMWAWPAFEKADLALAPGLKYMGQINSVKRTVKACLETGIPISEARLCWSPAVAEMALTLALAGLRRTSEYHCAMRQGTETWVGQFPAEIDVRERSLSGRPVGIVGFGGIGQRLAELLEPFHVDLRVYDPYIPEAVIERFQAHRSGLMELVQESDVVVLCATNQESARGIIGRPQIEALRKDAVLINVGRSMLVDMPALQERLKQGDLVAMLDVFDQEPLEADSPLRSLPNTYLTPHRAGGLIESVALSLEWLIGDLEAVLEGKPRICAVTEAMMPSFPE